MRQMRNIAAPLAFALCAVVFVLWLNTQARQRTTIERLNDRIKQLTIERDDAKRISKQKQNAEVDSFLRDYSFVFEMLRDREILIYKQLIEADSNILARIEKFQTKREIDVNKKWAKYATNNTDNRKLMEGRFINMLKGEIRYCEHHIRIVEDGLEDENEYSRMEKTYPEPLFYEPEKDAAEN